MVKIITIANQKGGVGKTTTCYAIGSMLRRNGKKVLYIDLDGQANLTDTLTDDIQSKTILELLSNKAAFSECITHTENGDIIPGNHYIATIEQEMGGNLTILADKLKACKYDYVMIDTPPSLGNLTLLALSTATHLIVPAQADKYSFTAIKDIVSTVQTVKTKNNPALKTLGIAITRFRPNTIFGQQMLENIKGLAKNLGTRVFNTPVRESISMQESQTADTDIYGYANKSNPALDYEQLTKEIMKEGKLK